MCLQNAVTIPPFVVLLLLCGRVLTFAINRFDRLQGECFFNEKNPVTTVLRLIGYLPGIRKKVRVSFYFFCIMWWIYFKIMLSLINLYVF